MFVPHHLPFFQPSRANSKILVLGCGNSNLSEDVLRDGWTGGITNVDFSEVVIEQMKAKVCTPTVFLSLHNVATTLLIHKTA